MNERNKQHLASQHISVNKQTIKELVELIDELRQPFNNSKRHDLYVKATEKLNKLEEEGRI